ncbi:hypothetical protein [Rheinheimera sp. 1928-s]|uniref:hypothetical protein n=1 Tax=Rheinheimera sp. 1928-s TaxID=3033803 RepID=UPI00260DA29C|nr:hypothetical protein [Rheinheimera sp. 1928-s]MDF3125275.1 hypothetical protein [Rheinheimera sp. 1928-s]
MDIIYLLITFGTVYLIFSVVEIKKNLKKILGEKYNTDDESIVDIVESIINGDVNKAKIIYSKKCGVTPSEADSTINKIVFILKKKDNKE